MRHGTLSIFGKILPGFARRRRVEARSRFRACDQVFGTGVLLKVGSTQAKMNRDCQRNVPSDSARAISRTCNVERFTRSSVTAISSVSRGVMGERKSISTWTQGVSTVDVPHIVNQFSPSRSLNQTSSASSAMSDTRPVKTIPPASVSPKCTRRK